jgi:hypothetical protein
MLTSAAQNIFQVGRNRFAFSLDVHLSHQHSEKASRIYSQVILSMRNTFGIVSINI